MRATCPHQPTNPPPHTGTHVAGTVGAIGNNQLGVTGVNWNVRLYTCKFVGPNGSGFESDAILCIQKLRAMGVKVLNNSWYVAQAP